MVTWITTILAIVIFVVSEVLGKKKEEKDRKFYQKLRIVIFLMLLIQIVNVIDISFKQNKQRREIKTSILNELKNNCEVIYTWQTCLNKNWTPKRHIITTMNSFELINLLNEVPLKELIINSYRSLIDAEGRIGIFRDGRGFGNKEEIDAMKRYLDICLEKTKESIRVLNDNLFVDKNRIENIYQKESDLSEEQIITSFMDYDENVASVVSLTLLYF